MLDEMRAAIPEEIKQARWIVRQNALSSTRAPVVDLVLARLAADPQSRAVLAAAIEGVAQGEGADATDAATQELLAQQAREWLRELDRVI